MTFYAKHKALFFEFLRYLLVGGGAFIVDFSSLFLLKEYVIPDLNGAGLYISTTIAFLLGLFVNYVFSLLFVFKVAKDENRGKTAKDVILFVTIGVIGLGLTNLGMYIGDDVLHINYLIVKLFVTAVVLLWNYGARKILIFGGNK